MLALLSVGGAIVDRAGGVTGLIDGARDLLGKKYTIRDGVPGQPSDAQMMWMLEHLTAAERTEYLAAYQAARKSSTVTLSDDVREIAFNAWGGDDGKVSTDAGKRFQQLTVQLLTRYPLGKVPQPGEHQTDGLREVLGTVVDRTKEALRGVFDETVADAARPAIARTVQRKAQGEWMPWIIAGALGVVLVVVVARGK